MAEEEVVLCQHCDTKMEVVEKGENYVFRHCPNCISLEDAKKEINDFKDLRGHN